MITFKMIAVVNTTNLTGSLIICPSCLESVYIFYAACSECGGDINDASNVVKKGLKGRLIYFKSGWLEMDRLSHERLKELRTIKAYKRR